MKDPREPNQFTCFDDDPRNTSGYGYNSPNPYDDYPEEIEDIEIEDGWEDDEQFD